MKRWDDANPTTFVNEPQDPSLNNKPKFTSIKQIKELNHLNARKSIGLLPHESHIKIQDKDPGLEYVHNPKHKTYKDIKAELKKESTDEFQKLGHYNFKGK